MDEIKEGTAAPAAQEQVPSTDATTEGAKPIAPVPQDAKLPELVAKLNEVVDRLNAKRDRGPSSMRTMTEDDARRVCLGDLKDASHTKAGEALGLSYGQVYSCRKGFTFKPIYKEMVAAKRHAETEAKIAGTKS